jgi:hypothetical protein
VPAYWSGPSCAARPLEVGGSPATLPIVYAAPATAGAQGKMVPLYDFAAADGRHAYDVDPTASLSGFTAMPGPIAYVLAEPDPTFCLRSRISSVSWRRTPGRIRASSSRPTEAAPTCDSTPRPRRARRARSSATHGRWRVRPAPWPRASPRRSPWFGGRWHPPHGHGRGRQRPHRRQDRGRRRTVAFVASSAHGRKRRRCGAPRAALGTPQWPERGPRRRGVRGAPGLLPSVYEVSDLPSASIAAATLAAAHLHATRADGPMPSVHVDRRHAAAAFRSER